MQLLEEVVENRQLFIFFFTWLGAICGHVLAIYKPDFNGTTPFLRKMFPDKSDTFYFRFDFVLLPIIGTILASVLLEPNSLKTSIFAGLSWSSTVTLIANYNHQKQDGQ